MHLSDYNRALYLYGDYLYGDGKPCFLHDCVSTREREREREREKEGEKEREKEICINNVCL